MQGARPMRYKIIMENAHTKKKNTMVVTFSKLHCQPRTSKISNIFFTARNVLPSIATVKHWLLAHALWLCDLAFSVYQLWMGCCTSWPRSRWRTATCPTRRRCWRWRRRSLKYSGTFQIDPTWEITTHFGQQHKDMEMEHYTSNTAML